MSLAGALRRKHARHADPVMRRELEHIEAEAVAAIRAVKPGAGRGAALGRLIGALVTAIGSPAVTEAAEAKLQEIEAAHGERL